VRKCNYLLAVVAGSGSRTEEHPAVGGTAAGGNDVFQLASVAVVEFSRVND
jgi:hypothetical protein